MYPQTFQLYPDTPWYRERYNPHTGVLRCWDVIPQVVSSPFSKKIVETECITIVTDANAKFNTTNEAYRERVENAQYKANDYTDLKIIKIPFSCMRIYNNTRCACLCISWDAYYTMLSVKHKLKTRARQRRILMHKVIPVPGVAEVALSYN